MTQSLAKCPRCNSSTLVLAPESTAESLFYECSACKRRWASTNGGDLHERWAGPLNVVLYGQIFEKDHEKNAERNALRIYEENADQPDYMRILIAEIDRELADPIQKVSEIHDFVFPNEGSLRKYLKFVSDYLKRKSAPTSHNTV